MASHSQKRSADFLRAYRSMLHDVSKSKVVPRAHSNSKVYSPLATVSTTEASSVFVPLFYAGEKGALGIWEKRCATGSIKRRLDDDDRSFHVLEMSNPRSNLGTYISAPKSALNALHITLPHLVICMKNYRRNFSFDILIMDSNAYRRRLCFATWFNPSSLKKFSFMCQVPLRLEIGWNEIHVDLNELVKATYKTSYVETIRIQIYANCKLRQIFFCDNKVMEGEIPIPSMRDFENIRILPLDFGPRHHPDTAECGPDKKRDNPYVDPPALITSSRLEIDLKHLQQRRFGEVSKQRLLLQPYKTYFRDMLQEQKARRRMAAVSLKAELMMGIAENRDTSSDDDKKDNANENGADTDKVPQLSDYNQMIQEKPLEYPVDEKEIALIKTSPHKKPVKKSHIMPKMKAEVLQGTPQWLSNDVSEQSSNAGLRDNTFVDPTQGPINSSGNKKIEKMSV